MFDMTEENIEKLAENIWDYKEKYDRHLHTYIQVWPGKNILQLMVLPPLMANKLFIDSRFSFAVLQSKDGKIIDEILDFVLGRQDLSESFNEYFINGDRQNILSSYIFFHNDHDSVKALKSSRHLQDLLFSGDDIFNQGDSSRSIDLEGEDFARIIVQHRNFDPNFCDGWETPLGKALLCEKEDIAKLIVQHPDFDPNLCDKYGETPLSKALSKDKEDIAKIIVQRPDFDPNLTDGEGNTPIIQALSWDKEDIALMIAQHPDFDPNLPDGDGVTPLQMAENYRYHDLAKLISEHEDFRG
jgi:hypothetical protein